MDKIFIWAVLTALSVLVILTAHISVYIVLITTCVSFVATIVCAMCKNHITLFIVVMAMFSSHLIALLLLKGLI